MRFPTSTRSLSEGIVRGLSTVLGGTVWSRRSFFVRTALFGSALAMDTKSFALTPRSAYDSVCGPLANCDDAFTAFCCTINNGANLCPTGTFVGGWWMADRSPFCRGDARYYVDCNGSPGTHWTCHCSDSPTCDKRKVACNIFRYGNCNTDVATYASPVVCRVVTCTPPWVWDKACTESTFIDQVTATESAACLPKPWSSPIEIMWSDLGGPGGPLGPEVTRVRSLPHRDGTWQQFRNGAIYDVAWLGLFVVQEPVWRLVKGRLGRDGIGYPVQDLTALPEGGGWVQAFVNRKDGHATEDAQAVGTPSLGTHLVTGEVLAKWHALGAQEGVLGFPTSDTVPTDDGLGTYGSFEKQADRRLRYRGAICAHPVTGVRELHGAVFAKWADLGGQSSHLGLPSSQGEPAGPGAELFRFAVVSGTRVMSTGAIVSTQQLGVHALWGVIFSTWEAAGGPDGQLRYPVSDLAPTPDGVGTYSLFSPLGGETETAGGAIVSSDEWGTWILLGIFATTWLDDEFGGRVLGVPSGAEATGSVNGITYGSQPFSTGALYNSDVGVACVLYGQILTQYLSMGGPSGSLGLPTSSVEVEADGEQVGNFQFGTLTYQPSEGS